MWPNGCPSDEGDTAVQGALHNTDIIAANPETRQADITSFEGFGEIERSSGSPFDIFPHDRHSKHYKIFRSSSASITSLASLSASLPPAKR